MPAESSPIDDGDEYELEAPDPHIEQRARQQAAKDLDAAREGLELDLATQALGERHLHADDYEFKFQFRVKHLLIATTVTSLALAMRELVHGDGFAVLMVLVFAALAGAYWYLTKQEEKAFQAVAARRAQAVLRVRERQAALDRGEDPPTIYDEPAEDASFVETVADHRFRPTFSLKETMIAMTVAAVAMGLGGVIGFEALAVLLGVVAVGGLTSYGMGTNPPALVVTTWWVTMGFYILLSISRIFTASN